MKEISKKQLAVLKAIQKYMKKNVYAPREVDLAQVLKISPSLCKYYLLRLKELGFIERFPPNAYRNIVLTGKALRILEK